MATTHRGTWESTISKESPDSRVCRDEGHSGRSSAVGWSQPGSSCPRMSRGGRYRRVQTPVGGCAVTVRVTTLRGVDAGAYYVEHLPNYYLAAGEPRGSWVGRGAATLGLDGPIGDDAFLELLAGMDPRQPDL